MSDEEEKKTFEENRKMFADRLKMFESTQQPQNDSNNSSNDSPPPPRRGPPAKSPKPKIIATPPPSNTAEPRRTPPSVVKVRHQTKGGGSVVVPCQSEILAAAKMLGSSKPEDGAQNEVEEEEVPEVPVREEAPSTNKEDEIETKSPETVPLIVLPEDEVVYELPEDDGEEPGDDDESKEPDDEEDVFVTEGNESKQQHQQQQKLKQADDAARGRSVRFRSKPSKIDEEEDDDEEEESVAGAAAADERDENEAEAEIIAPSISGSHNNSQRSDTYKPLSEARSSTRSSRKEEGSDSSDQQVLNPQYAQGDEIRPRAKKGTSPKEFKPVGLDTIRKKVQPCAKPDRLKFKRNPWDHVTLIKNQKPFTFMSLSLYLEENGLNFEDRHLTCFTQSQYYYDANPLDVDTGRDGGDEEEYLVPRNAAMKKKESPVTPLPPPLSPRENRPNLPPRAGGPSPANKSSSPQPSLSTSASNRNTGTTTSTSNPPSGGNDHSSFDDENEPQENYEPVDVAPPPFSL